MCGLYGIFGQGIQLKDMKVFRDLMLVNSLRGIDGTGVYAGRAYSTGVKFIDGVKEAGDPFYWQYTYGTRKNRSVDLFSVSNHFVIGHARWRSAGAHGMPGVQPFVRNEVVGSHNGTILSYNDNFDGEPTDSARLIRDISLVDPLDVSDVTSKLYEDDAYALVWYDGRNKHLNFLHNGGRSLHLAFNEDREVGYWSSEERALKFALDGQKYRLWTLNPHHLASVSPNALKATKNLDDFPLYTFKVSEPKKKAPKKESVVTQLVLPHVSPADDEYKIAAAYAEYYGG